MDFSIIFYPEKLAQQLVMSEIEGKLNQDAKNLFNSIDKTISDIKNHTLFAMLPNELQKPIQEGEQVARNVKELANKSKENSLILKIVKYIISWLPKSYTLAYEQANGTIGAMVETANTFATKVREGNEQLQKLMQINSNVNDITDNVKKLTSTLGTLAVSRFT